MRSETRDEFLYDPLDEHDACGVGIVANVSGCATHNIIESALEALRNLTHRGAVDADGRTGDGAGLLTQLPLRFFRREAERLGLRPDDYLAVGMFFLPREESAAELCRHITIRQVEDHGLIPLGWRQVPVEEGVLGSKALTTAPRIEQLLVCGGRVPNDRFETTLYRARSEIEQQLSEINGFYIPSFSSRTIVYKGLFVGSQIGTFYPDLNDPEFEAPLAVFHQRYSTNTFPNWALAQPFRLLAHNGEINTISGNRSWMKARELDSRFLSSMNGSGPGSVIWNRGSDSASLDNALELSVRSGREVTESMMILIPEAYEKSDEMSSELRTFYDYAASLTEPWDGPAALAFTDGQIVGAALDRNGLRPARYAVTRDGLVIVASEAGVIRLTPDRIAKKGRLGPGQMIAVDTANGVLLANDEIKSRVATRRPSVILSGRYRVEPPDLDDHHVASSADERELIRRMKSFGYTVEDVERLLGPMLANGKEPVGSMGDDTPLAMLSSKPRLLYSYFKQRFAQVTNPAIDPIRERLVMSLTTLLGSRALLTEELPTNSPMLNLSSPIQTDAMLEWLTGKNGAGLSCATLPAVFEIAEGGAGLKMAIAGLCRAGSEAVDAGCSILIIDDLPAGESEAPIPMLLAVGALHNHLIREGQRMRASIIARSGEARDDHQVACLIGFGANAVCPSLGFDVIAHEGPRRGLTVADAMRNYRRALEDGLLKIMAKMGISTVAGYCGSQTFEIVGLEKSLVEEYFSGAPRRLTGIGLDEIAADSRRFYDAARQQAETPLEDAGFFRYRFGGEYHTFNPAVFRALHRAAKGNDPDEYARYSNEVLGRPTATLRDLIEVRPGPPIALGEVEPAEQVLKRFSTSGMSLGALSKKAHETLAIAMNRLGAKSNSGEGGEDSRRFRRRPGGDLANSRIKQVASARFGVTPAYLVSADELEIKIAQGSKPGEGGQLPGDKVTAEIAAIRHSVPGVTLISPPPHHDIYSIEDLAQLIYDLKQINPEARIAVKLVSEAGIGTIAAGVAKAGADLIHISGHDGGTGASPLGSIKNAGTPWEIGLAETQQALVMNNLRARVRLRVDGGLKTGRDVMVASMLGADEFGFATSAVVALGCVMARQCHLNTCPVGIATQDPALRRKFVGTPEQVMSFFQALAEDVRKSLAAIGYRSIDEIVGRCDLLSQKHDPKLPRCSNIDLGPLLRRAQVRDLAVSQIADQRSRDAGSSLSKAIDEACSESILDGSAIAAAFEVCNTDRSIGARVAGNIARKYGDAGLADGTINLSFSGSAGQSFGAFNISGLRLNLIGEANDYVGKGMSGGEIIIRPSNESSFDWSENVIIGNTVMYGATGGTLLAAGRAGERFCVRNSGGVAVVEGVGDHGCEYMTAGAVVVLGEVGRNFAAGMTGGVAYVLDERGEFQTKCNRELVELVRVAEPESDILRALIERHYEMTSSPRARQLLSDWEQSRNLFWQVVTQAEAARQREAELPQISLAAAFDRSTPVVITD
jgi:glutamate synthase domain-containing protein 2/glutamate synthase domain-containing protein 1/glutamate synthase domain-containing protein 3